jgi:hypothetical protein
VLSPIEIQGFCSSEKRRKEKENLSCHSGFVSRALLVFIGEYS